VKTVVGSEEVAPGGGGLDRQAVAESQRDLEAWSPGGRGSSARQSLLREKFKGVVRLAVRDTRKAVWKLAAPGGTCPPPGE